MFGDSPDSPDSITSLQSAPEASRPLDPYDEDYHRNQVARAVQNQDIVPGMTTGEVISAWGRPQNVEIAGDGSRGNERWIYYSGNSLRYGISRSRIIYFENNHVVGWESQ